MLRTRARTALPFALLATLAGLSPGCGRVGFGVWPDGPTGALGDRSAWVDGHGGGDPRAADPFAADPSAADPFAADPFAADPAGGDGGLSGCLAGSEAIVNWAFAFSSTDASDVITSVPDMAGRAPDVPLAGDGTTTLAGGVAVLSGSSLVPMSVTDKNDLIAALAGTRSFTVVAWLKTANNGQYGKIFSIWFGFGIGEDHTALPVNVGGGYTASFGQPFAGPATEIFVAGGWDDGTHEVVGYAEGPLRSGPVATFDPASWVPADIELIVGNDGNRLSPWQGDLRQLMIFDRVLSDAETQLLRDEWPAGLGLSFGAAGIAVGRRADQGAERCV